MAYKGFIKWSRRESNSGPNKQLKSFLHVYFLIEFSMFCPVRNNHKTLSFLISKSTQSLWKSRFIFTVPLNWPPQTKAFKENPAFLSDRNEANLTIIQIMQLERSYFRRVKSRRPFIYENCPSSRRAYFSIRLAVKTSRPQISWNKYNLLLSLSQVKQIRFLG